MINVTFDVETLHVYKNKQNNEIMHAIPLGGGAWKILRRVNAKSMPQNPYTYY
jgi:hypothetical protein